MSAELSFTDFARELIDEAIGPETPEAAAQRTAREDSQTMAALGFAPWQGGGIATKGCPKCKGTMKRTQERGGGSQWVCSNTKCGYVE